VLFFGTPKAHKGLLETAQALASLRRDDVVFAIVGDFPPEHLGIKDQLQKIGGVEYVFVGNQPFESIPEVVAVGDICVLWQDSDSMVSKFQIPAKLSDALAMGLTVLLGESAAVADIIESKAVVKVSQSDLARVLDRILSAQGERDRLGNQARELFTKEFGFAINRRRLTQFLRGDGDWDWSEGLSWLLGSLPSIDSVFCKFEADDWDRYLVYHRLGVTWEKLGYVDQAVRAYRQAIKLNPTGIESLLGLSRVLQEMKGVSIIILSLNAATLLDRLLSTFFQTNTYSPVEIIIIDHGSRDNTEEIVRNQAQKGDINYINRGANFSFSESCNYGASLAKYPYLLFLNNDIVFTSDVLPMTVNKLNNDLNIGAVGVRLDDDPCFLSLHQEATVQHTGIKLVWHKQRGYFQPEQIRYPSVKDYLSQSKDDYVGIAVTGAFLLCRKADFELIGGFSTDYYYGLEDIDFCLRLGKVLQKKSYCINNLSLQHFEGATRRQSPDSNFIETNHQIFKKNWNSYIWDLINISMSSDRRYSSEEQLLNFADNKRLLP
jgi:GT2 family glycosyltransferase